MKGDIAPNHIPVNKFQLFVLGLPPITFTEISGIEQETASVELPDRTVRSGGVTLPIEFTAKVPSHHVLQIAVLEAWRADAVAAVPGYLKEATLIQQSVNGQVFRTRTLVHMWPSKESVPDLDMMNDGEISAEEYTFKADEILSI